MRKYALPHVCTVFFLAALLCWQSEFFAEDEDAVQIVEAVSYTISGECTLANKVIIIPPGGKLNVAAGASLVLDNAGIICAASCLLPQGVAVSSSKRGAWGLAFAGHPIFRKWKFHDISLCPALGMRDNDWAGLLAKYFPDDIPGVRSLLRARKISMIDCEFTDVELDTGSLTCLLFSESSAILTFVNITRVSGASVVFVGNTDLTKVAMSDWEATQFVWGNLRLMETRISGSLRAAADDAFSAIFRGSRFESCASYIAIRQPAEAQGADTRPRVLLDSQWNDLAVALFDRTSIDLTGMHVPIIIQEWPNVYANNSKVAMPDQENVRQSRPEFGPRFGDRTTLGKMCKGVLKEDEHREGK